MKYATPQAFKAALEDRLRNQVRANHDLGRLRQLVVYDRFLCRVLTEVDLSVVLKGGVVLELRLPFARATKDIDLRASGPPDGLLQALQRAGRRTIDPLRFEVSVDPKHPTIAADGMIYEGLRFRVQCTLAGRIYGRPFGLDVAFADPIYGAPETLPASTWFDFAGLDGVPIPVVPLETHIAEKLH
ncbi:MAG: nucleotidyl transferase AbiEii/AbiGii toxin family protein, partial [Myxococcota bacterium]